MNPVIAANWKMNTTVKEAIVLARELKESLKGVKDRDIVVCPPFVSLSELRSSFHRTNIALGAQNMYFEEKGAFTGEISPVMLKELCNWVIIGHSERRHVFDEDNYVINKKVQSALKHHLKTILCVGELDEERSAGKQEEVVSSQLKEGLAGLDGPELSDVCIAYEPVWAIGTGKTATPEEAEHMHEFIRSVLKELFGEYASKVRILYGGSVKPENVDALMTKPEIQGVLVGGASLDAKSFARIANYEEL